METDLIGIYPVAHYIEDSGCSKFKIYRGKSSTGVTPIFQSDESKNNKEAVYNFKKWATNSLQNNANGNIYELKVYSKDEGENYKGAIQFSLIAQNLGVLNGDNSNLSEERISKAISEGIRLATLENELKQLKQDYEDLNNEIDEEDKEEKPNQLIEALGKLAGLVGVVIPKKNESDIALSGVESDEQQTQTKKLTKEQCVNINTAVQILFLADNNIDKSLLKLADISQKNKSQFTFLLNALKNM